MKKLLVVLVLFLTGCAGQATDFQHDVQHAKATTWLNLIAPDGCEFLNDRYSCKQDFTLESHLNLRGPKVKEVARLIRAGKFDDDVMGGHVITMHECSIHETYFECRIPLNKRMIEKGTGQFIKKIVDGKYRYIFTGK